MKKEILKDETPFESFLRRGLGANSYLWFAVLEDAIEAFLCGLGDEFKKPKSRKKAEKWIFGSKDFQFGFNEIWNMFFEHDPEIVKDALKKRYKKRLNDFRRKGKCGDAKTQGTYRRRQTTSGDFDPYRGDRSILGVLSGQHESVVCGQSLSGHFDDDGEHGFWK